MRNLTTRIAMSVIAFGFFISCNQTYQSLNSTATELSVDSGLADAYMLIGNEADAEIWYNRLDR